MVVEHIPSPDIGTKRIVEKYYTGSREDNEFYDQIKNCDSSGPLCINIVKMFNKQDCLRFDAFGRVISGT
jgi:hypothetical protein